MHGGDFPRLAGVFVYVCKIAFLPEMALQCVFLEDHSLSKELIISSSLSPWSSILMSSKARYRLRKWTIIIIITIAYSVKLVHLFQFSGVRKLCMAQRKVWIWFLAISKFRRLHNVLQYRIPSFDIEMFASSGLGKLHPKLCHSTLPTQIYCRLNKCYDLQRQKSCLTLFKTKVVLILFRGCSVTSVVKLFLSGYVLKWIGRLKESKHSVPKLLKPRVPGMVVFFLEEKYY